jgi:hypothetical protein
MLIATGVLLFMSGLFICIYLYRIPTNPKNTD